MPQFIENGPDIPEDLIYALKAQKLVFFCGAGISMYTGLPNFKGLVENIILKLNLPEGSHEKKLLKEECYDELLNYLEQKYQPGQIRQLVSEVLSVPYKNKLDFHEAILDLSKSKNGYRLVTTNFDNRFLETRKINHNNIHIAPALPIPDSNSWHSVVHLHGLLNLNNDSNDYNLLNLVLTSADFGNALLNAKNLNLV